MKLLLMVFGKGVPVVQWFIDRLRVTGPFVTQIRKIQKCWIVVDDENISVHIFLSNLLRYKL